MRIIHVFRGAVGGVLRHVCDQVQGQAASGHDIGIICDSLTGGEAATEKLAALLPLCALGIERIAISNAPGLSDFRGLAHTAALASRLKADILHGHGAKGGMFARLAARKLGLASVYTPHGGSLHYEWRSPKGALFLGAEKLLRVKGSGLAFVCEFERNVFAQKIEIGPCPTAIIYNGLGQQDFKPRQLSANATDFLFVGEMRSIKGVDVLLNALALIDIRQRPSLTLVGDGPQEAEFAALAQSLGLSSHVKFVGRKLMVEAMALGRILVVPSIRESFPYVVIEAMAASIPIIAADVGGISEALPEDCLFPAGNIGALAEKLHTELASSKAHLTETEKLRLVAAERFSTDRMVGDTLAFYKRLI